MRFDSAGACPRCTRQAVRSGQGEPWCPSCEWNLAAYDPDIVAPLGWGWFDKLSHRMAYRLDQREFERFRAELPTSHRWSFGRVWLIAISLLLLLAGLVSAVAGCWLILADFPSWWMLLGAVLLGLAALVRPRPGRLPPAKHRLRREQAPSLFALIDRVADRVGTPAPDVIVLDHSFNASIDRVGWRRRTVLWLGAPLWLTLDPGMRVALLAHELGHGVNADPERGRLTEPALNTFRRLAIGSDSNRSIGEILNPDQPRPNLLSGISRLALWLVSRMFLLVHLAVVAVAARDHQRAEYFADRVSTEVAGSAAAQRLLDQVMLGGEILTSVRYNAHRVGPLRWRQLAAELEAGTQDQRSLHRQFSRRATSLWSSHPPDGLRAELVEAWPSQPAGLLLTQAASDHIDRDLAFWFTGYHRRILGTRMFQESA